MKNLISVNGKNAMKSPKINKGPERYSVMQLRRLADSYVDDPGLSKRDLAHIEILYDYLSWLEKQ